MPQEQLDAPLDAFAALMAGVSPSSTASTATSSPSSMSDLEQSPYSGPIGVQPRTRREARALRQAQEALSGLVGPSPISAPVPLAAEAPVSSSVVASPAVSASAVPAQALPIASAPLISAPLAPAAPAFLSTAVASLPPVPGSAAPLTRRELREREERAAASAGTSDEAAAPAVERVRAARLAPQPAKRTPPVAASTKPARRVGKAAFASLAALGLVPALIISPMAFAQQSPSAGAASLHGAPDAQGRAQSYVDKNVTAQHVETFDVASAATVNKVVTAADQSVLSTTSFDEPQAKADMANAANVVSADLQLGGKRQTIIETALNYIGTPYVLGGASKAGVDCSGLTLLAYQAVGITLEHYVPTQDAAGARIPASQAKPGDLVTFDDEDHVGIYLGGNLVLHAPDWGRPVQIESLTAWSSIPYHFTRILGVAK